MSPRGDLASYGSRVGATLLDGLVIAAVAFVVLLLVGSATEPDAIDSSVVLGIVLLNSLIYAPLLLCRSGAHNGQTLGKQALSIRAVRQDAEAITAPTALMREFVGKGLLGLIPLFTIVDFLFPLADDRRQAIHDKLAKTFVVRADAVPDLGREIEDPFGARGPEAPATPPSGWAPPSPAPTTGDDRPTPTDAGWGPPVPRAPAPKPDDDAPRGPFGPTGH